MPDETTRQGIVESYIWKPSRLSVRDGTGYIPIDIISDGTTEEVSQAVNSEGQEQIRQINALAASEKAKISAHERDYTAIRVSLENNYRMMYNYFMSQGSIALATIMATAIVNLHYT